MKKRNHHKLLFTLGALICGMFIGILQPPVSVQATPLGTIESIFPDPNLAAKIAALLGNGTTVTSSVEDTQLSQITTLILNAYTNNGLTVSDLTGVGHLSGLTYLDLSGNPISDFSPLTGLSSLETLYISDTGFTDLSLLTPLTSLTSLGLGGNNITDVSHFSTLTNLNTLNLDDNNITDVSHLATLTNLNGLNLDDNNITNVGPLSALTSLTSLSLGDNNITDISSLSPLINLVFLSLSKNDITHTSHLSTLTNLQCLYLNDNNITDTSHIAALSNLTLLTLNGNNITDASPLAALTGLMAPLDLCGNYISDFSPLINAGIPFLGIDTQRPQPPQPQQPSSEPPTTEKASYQPQQKTNTLQEPTLIVNEVKHQDGTVSKHTLEGIYNSRTVRGCVLTTPAADLETAAGLTTAQKKEGAVLKYYVCEAPYSKTRTLLIETAAQDGFKLAGVINADLYLLQGSVTTIRELNTTAKMVLGIPNSLRKEGRKFSLLCFDSKGSKILLPDTDSDNQTITVDTSVFGLFAICYQD